MMVNGESESGEDEKGRKKVEEGEGMAGFRPGKKRGKSWGEGVATTSLGFCRAPSFLCKCLFFSRRVSGNGLLLGFYARPLCAYTEICIYNARVPSRVRNKVSIKLILFFKV